MPGLGACAARAISVGSGGSPRQVAGGWSRSGVGSWRQAWERGEDKVGCCLVFYFLSFYFPTFRLSFLFKTKAVFIDS
jgi:hypothetical protein